MVIRFDPPLSSARGKSLGVLRRSGRRVPAALPRGLCGRARKAADLDGLTWFFQETSAAAPGRGGGLVNTGAIMGDTARGRQSKTLYRRRLPATDRLFRRAWF